MTVGVQGIYRHWELVSLVLNAPLITNYSDFVHLKL